MRLQEIKEKVGTPFGGVSILAFGDLMQLQPVQGKYILNLQKIQNSGHPMLSIHNGDSSSPSYLNRITDKAMKDHLQIPLIELELATTMKKT